MKKYITREMKTDLVAVNLYDRDLKEEHVAHFEIPECKGNEARIRSEVGKLMSDNQIILDIQEVKTTRKLFGVEESVFLENAVELDPNTRKPYKDNVDDLLD